MRRLLALSLLLVLAVGALWLEARREGTKERGLSAERASSPEPRVELTSAAAVPGEPTKPSSGDATRTQLSEVKPTARAAPAPRTMLSGRVVRPDGAPIGGVEVEIESDGPFRSKLAPLASTKTKTDGSFSFVNTY